MSALPIPPSSGTTVLDRIGARQADAEQAERDVLTLAVEYAAAHQAPGVTEAEAWFGDRPLDLAGPGAPGVSEFAVAELAAVLGMSTDAGRRFLGQALEVAHRLPRVWRRIQDGQVAAWRARRVAEKTIALSQAGAAYVDTRVAGRLDKIGPATLARLVDEAKLLSEEPAEDATLDQQALRQARIDTHSSAVHGIAYLDATLDVSDALDLEQALQTAARELKDHGNTNTLDVRRSQALGLIARRYLASTGAEAGTGSDTTGGVQLYVHYAPDTELGHHDRIGLENTRGLTTLDQLAEWLDRPGRTTIKITPVIDLNATLTSSGYVPGPRLREQTILRDQTCVFPGCTHPARTGDLDHIEAYDTDGPPGQTNSDNLACLCRPHHRIKTHGGWTYQSLEPGYHLWRSPTGRRYLRTPTGTINLT